MNKYWEDMREMVVVLGQSPLKPWISRLHTISWLGSNRNVNQKKQKLWNCISAADFLYNFRELSIFATEFSSPTSAPPKKLSSYSG